MLELVPPQVHRALEQGAGRAQQRQREQVHVRHLPNIEAHTE